MFELTPEFVLIVQFIIQLNLYIDNAIFAFGESFLLSYFFVSEDIFFQRFGHLFHHVFSCISGGYCNDDTLTDCEVGKFVFSHFRQTVNAESDKTTYYQNDNLPVVHGTFHSVTLFIVFIHCRMSFILSSSLFLHILFVVLPRLPAFRFVNRILQLLLWE